MHVIFFVFHSIVDSSSNFNGLKWSFSLLLLWLESPAPFFEHEVSVFPGVLELSSDTLFLHVVIIKSLVTLV